MIKRLAPMKKFRRSRLLDAGILQHDQALAAERTETTLQRLVAGATRAAGGAHTPDQALAPFHRSQNRSRQDALRREPDPARLLVPRANP
jgi:hypothetical protein